MGHKYFGKVITTIARGRKVFEEGYHANKACGAPILAVWHTCNVRVKVMRESFHPASLQHMLVAWQFWFYEKSSNGLQKYSMAYENVLNFVLFHVPIWLVQLVSCPTCECTLILYDWGVYVGVTVILSICADKICQFFSPTEN